MAWPPGSEPRDGSCGGTDPAVSDRMREEPRNAKAFVGLVAALGGPRRRRRRMRPRPAAALRGLQAEAGRTIARRLREPPPGGRRMGPILVPRPALAHDAVP